MKQSFLNKSHPVITAIMAGQTPQELIAEIKNSEFDGAHGVAIDLSDLKPEFRNTDGLKSIIDAAHLPVMFFFYRNDKWDAHNNTDDERRQEILLTAAEAGAAMIDVMGDLYDPSPREITHNHAAIDKQMQLIGKIRAKGAETIISSHMECHLSCDEVVAHLQAMEKRGSDVVKIVTTVNTEAELTEAIRTTMTLKHELKKPFIHICNGKFSRLHRFLSPTLGSAISFAVQRYESRYAMQQPTIKAIKTVLDNLHWNINDFL